MAIVEAPGSMAGEGSLVRWCVEHDLSRQRFDEAVPVLFSLLAVVFVSPFVLVRQRVNDTHGHDTGDRVPVEVTGRSDQSIRAGDSRFRYGGEELVVPAHGARSEPAGRRDESPGARIRRTPIPSVGYVSVSIGVAGARRGDQSGGWFRRADKGLYRAERGGRNCVRVDRAAGTPADAGINTGPA